MHFPRLTDLARFTATACWVAGVCSSSFAQTKALGPDWLALLSRCDAKFFEAFKEHGQALHAQAPVVPRGKAAAIEVPMHFVPLTGEHNHVMFKQPLKLHGLEVMGYFDELSLDPGGFILNWGFFVKTSIAQTAALAKPATWDAQRFVRQSDDVYLRSEVWRSAQPERGWSKEMVEPGPAKPGTVERVFMVWAVADEGPKLTRLGCSLQGRFPRKLAAQLRPDLTEENLELLPEQW